jgi:hypothetical protein
MRIHRGVGIFVAVLALSLSNCASKYHDYCQAQADCEGGNDKDVDACVDSLRGTENAVGEYDCGDQWDDAFDCLDGKGICDNGHYKVTDPSCNAKLASYAACVKAASGTKDSDGFTGEH